MDPKHAKQADITAQIVDFIKLVILALPITLICLFDIVRTLITGRSKTFAKSNIYRHRKTERRSRKSKQ